MLRQHSEVNLLTAPALSALDTLASNPGNKAHNDKQQKSQDIIKAFTHKRMAYRNLCNVHPCFNTVKRNI